MKLRISYFNGSVLRKNVSRFAPVWGLYVLGLFLVMSVFYNENPVHMAQSLVETMTTLSYVNFAYAFLCATVLFGDLFQSRMCNALHAMPMRRGGWFLTHTVSGFLFALIPYGLLSIVAGILLQDHAFLAFWWFVSNMGQFLFHFGLAVLCAMCVGTRFAHGVLYSILCFLSLLLYWIISVIIEPLLYGIRIDMVFFRFACPTAFLGSNGYFIWDYSTNTGMQFKSFDMSIWAYLAVSAGIGLISLILALSLYRRRKLETAGDFISIVPLSPAFLLLYTLTAGTVFHTFGEIFSSGIPYVFLFIGLITGFYTGRMLLERSLKVFRWKSNLACFLFLLFIGATLTVTYLDPLGLTKWVPEPTEVKSVSITFSGTTTTNHPLTDPEDIDTITSVHTMLLENKDSSGYWIELQYELLNGRTVKRTYYLSSIEPDFKNAIVSILSRWDVAVADVTPEYLLENIHYISASSIEPLPQEVYGELLEAIQKDCEAGNMSQSYGLHDGDIHFIFLEINYTDTPNSGIHVLYLDIYESCANTVAVLKQYVPEEYWWK